VKPPAWHAVVHFSTVNAPPPPGVGMKVVNVRAGVSLVSSVSCRLCGYQGSIRRMNSRVASPRCPPRRARICDRTSGRGCVGVEDGQSVRSTASISRFARALHVAFCISNLGTTKRELIATDWVLVLELASVHYRVGYQNVVVVERSLTALDRVFSPRVHISSSTAEVDA
jgi:hypothetical protein